MTSTKKEILDGKMENTANVYWYDKSAGSVGQISHAAFGRLNSAIMCSFSFWKNTEIASILKNLNMIY